MRKKLIEKSIPASGGRSVIARAVWPGLEPKSSNSHNAGMMKEGFRKGATPVAMGAAVTSHAYLLLSSGTVFINFHKFLLPAKNSLPTLVILRLRCSGGSAPGAQTCPQDTTLYKKIYLELCKKKFTSINLKQKKLFDFCSYLSLTVDTKNKK
jgi:hypothetical protein